MPSIYRPRRPRASPLWQIVHHGWSSFLAEYEAVHRPIHGPLRPDAAAVVEHFYRCGDLAFGFTRLLCPDCGHEKLLSFSCKTRDFCPSCHQRRVKQVAHWIAHDLCFNVPHRQFVFTMPKPLRGIFRKRRKLLTLLFQVAVGCLRDWFRTRLDLPDGEIAAVAGVQSFGDYLVFHPHLHILTAAGLIDREGRFHEVPIESVEPLEELFRSRFLATLRREKLISEKKQRQLLGWTHSGFNLDAGEEPVAAHDVKGRQRLAEYLLRAPFSLEKITWNESTKQVIYRSERSWHTKSNFKIFTTGESKAKPEIASRRLPEGRAQRGNSWRLPWHTFRRKASKRSATMACIPTRNAAWLQRFSGCGPLPHQRPDPRKSFFPRRHPKVPALFGRCGGT